MAQTVGDLTVELDVNAAKFNEQVTRVRQQLTGLGTAANDASLQTQKAFSTQEIAARRAGISVGQYRMAMQMLPAQMTDVAVQLAGGQNPWLILLQQGGQVKDSFGGLRGTFFALASTISPVKLGLVGLGAAIGTIAYAFYQGSSVLSDFNKTLVLSGNSAGLTASKMFNIATAAELSGVTFGQASAALTALVNAGVSAGARFEQMTIAVSRFTTVSGVPLEKVAEAFAKLSDDPSSGLIAMAKQFHNVTAEQIAYVAALQRSGDETAALQAANELATSGFETQTSRIEQNMGTIERAANSLSRTFKSMWDAALDIGRPDTSAGMLKKAQEAFDRADKIWSLRKGDPFVNDTARARYWNNRETSRLALDMAQQQALVSKATEDNARREAEAESARQKYAAQAQTNYTKTQTALEKYTARQKELNDALKTGNIIQADYDINMKAAKKAYEDSLKKPGAVRTSAGDRSFDNSSAQTLALEAQLRVLQQHTGVNDTISRQRQALWEMQAKFSVLEDAARNRALSKEDQSLLASKSRVLAQAEINAKLGDQIVVQERLNKLQDTSQKYVTQMAEKTAALRDSTGSSNRQTQRNLEEAQLRQGWVNQGGRLNDSGYQAELDALHKYHAEQDVLRSSWQAGAKSAWSEYADAATNAYSQVQQVGLATLNGLSGQLTQFLTTGKSNFKDFTRSILTMLTDIMVKASLVKGLSALGFGSLVPNAKGGVYSSASLSSFSGQIVDNPTLFAFARGAGLMGEAGPEAIMPLTRNANGVLGVRALGAVAGGAPQVSISITNEGVSTQSSAGYEQLGKDIGQFVDHRFKVLLAKETGQGGGLTRARAGRR
ncbi:phage tail tape measure protein [Candidatus Symbiopectobacterium sp. NZEC127]|uniref:phage tail tape measure protein n=1 Tax=Candidatus Symbiopectobacterium sp. NZEC127 TaxID=2820472 RepID=UPI0022272BA1|nr:phage tail tape measure protein [Candidatus Symbiopectobacterium sp. NZEC127]MCW2484987.1 phage tail tape measure protein [Candidatus Symbiopectobacterium sp. NZEC127]